MAHGKSPRANAEYITMGIHPPSNIDPTDQQLPWELSQFQMNYDKDTIPNMYGQEVLDFINNLRGYKNRAKKADIKWDYNDDKHLSKNRWYQKHKNDK